MDNESLVQEFVGEAKGHVEKIELGLLEIEKGHQTQELIHDVFRSAHSIKGTAGFFGLEKIVALAHAMETLLGKLRSETVTIGQNSIDALLAANDKLRRMLDHIEESNEEDIADCIEKLQAASGPMGAGKAPGAIASPLSLPKSMVPGQPVPNKTDYQKMFAELIKKGHKVYKLLLPLDENPVRAEKTLNDIDANIRSIGIMIRSQTSENINENYTGYTAVFVFSTILDQELVLIALGIDKQEIVQLDIRNKAREIQALLREMQQPQAERHLLKEHQPEILVSSEEMQWRQSQEERVRVDIDLLNNLVNLSSEMILARNQLLRLLTDCTDKIPGLQAVLQRIDQTTTKLQENIMQTRMQPVANLFNSAPRMVRELSRTLGKRVELHMEGQGVELDKSILEGLKDPFAHLLRNALDHGIETPQRRQKTGKKGDAALYIKAYNEGGRVIIDITDDGAGINLIQVREKAVEKSLLTPEQAAVVSEQELLRMIFLPGFSTNSEVNDVSGRGVGLDVVHANVEKLGGTVEVYTELAKGTTFRLILPLTLAIMPSLLVEAEKHQFVLPQASVREIIRILPDGGFYKLEAIQGHCVLRLRGRLIPVIQLGKAVGLPGVSLTTKSIQRVLVVKKGEKNFGLLVDNINDREDILVKPLPCYLKDKKVYSGVTILGDGKIAMVLDTEGIARMVNFPEVEAQLTQKVSSEPSIPFHVPEMRVLLLFKAAGCEAFGLELSQVAKIKKINPEQIEYVGGQEYYYFQGNILRLLRLEDFLPVGRSQKRNDRMYVIIPKGGLGRIGILAVQMIDAIKAELQVIPSAFAAKGILGSVLVDGRMILLLDVPGLSAMASIRQDV